MAQHNAHQCILLCIIDFTSSGLLKSLKLFFLKMSLDIIYKEHSLKFTIKFTFQTLLIDVKLTVYT